jgi:hypothetical protein
MLARHSWMTILVSCVILQSTAAAQFVFFDDFEGNDLLPHWLPPPSNYWEYNVSNRMLNVTGLFHPGVGSNHAVLWTHFEHQSDFRVDVWMGWQEGGAPQRLELRVLGPWAAGPTIARFGYRFMQGTGHEIYAGDAVSSAVFAPAPAAGIHHLTITRSAAQFDFFLNGSPFASFPDLFGLPAGGLNIEFLGPVGGQFGTLHVDRVRVVPAPGTIIVLAAGSMFLQRARRAKGAAA